VQGLGVLTGELGQLRKVLDNNDGYGNAGYANRWHGFVWCVNYEH